MTATLADEMTAVGLLVVFTGLLTGWADGIRKKCPKKVQQAAVVIRELLGEFLDGEALVFVHTVGIDRMIRHVVLYVKV